MSATNRIRVLVRTRGTGTDIFRTLVSLACQDIGPRRLEIVLAATDPDLHTGREARLLHSALDFSAVEVLDARGLTSAQALNLAASDGDAGHLALLPEGARLHPQFMSRCLTAMRGKKRPQVVFCEHTAGSVERRPFSRRPAFRPEQLIRRNAAGPVALIQRTAWDILGGLHPALEYNQWDFWLRLALAGGRLTEAPGLLASCPPLRRLAPEQDGRAKALLVVHTPGAFEPDVCRWAMALLRGDPWAAPFEPGVIPSPRDVGALFAGLVMPQRPGSIGWDNRQRWTA
ncbi:MAG: hypothetical protein CVU73_01850 [Deltaproteobacteria bacterium HGW-Deltaproteobacteria-8]|jgi:hypothetical protein|nr:MAG: hypothetical protein CVU73_01850 [Deltaproteobacteria bacterium HGW-Deltaproteobacteria-8]